MRYSVNTTDAIHAAGAQHDLHPISALLQRAPAEVLSRPAMLWGAVKHMAVFYAVMAIGWLMLYLMTQDTRRLRELRRALQTANSRPCTAADYMHMPGLGIM